jgi:threonine/homoserine/homoserine lactone efflux protein
MTPQFWVFAITALLLNLTPGNDMLYVMARSSGQGIRAGIFSALGIGLGCLVHVFAAMAGLSALIAGSAIAFTIIKLIGAVYLIYLGARSLFNRKKNLLTEKQLPLRSLKKIFWQGVWTNVLNPKVALFFLAFLPQFISPEKGHTALQIIFLGTWFDAGGTVVNVLVAILFGKFGSWISHSPSFVRWQEKITGMILVTLGIKLALGSKK